MAAWDMFLVTTIGRMTMGVLAALMFGFIGFLFWSVAFPPLAGLTFHTFVVVNSIAVMVVFGTSAAWFKTQAEWRTRFVAGALIIIGAFVGGWLGYDYGFDKGIEELKDLYFGKIPGGELRVPTGDGVRWSLLVGALAANVMALGHHIWRIWRYNDPGDY